MGYDNTLCILLLVVILLVNIAQVVVSLRANAEGAYHSADRA